MNTEGLGTGLDQKVLAKAGSLEELLKQLRDRIPTALIDGPEWEKVLRRARSLPASLGARGLGLELPLHERTPRADIGAALFAGAPSAAHFSDWCRSQPETAAMKEIPRLLREMEREGSELGRIVEHKLMLGYDDVSAHGDKAPDPGIFVYAEDALSDDGSAERLQDLRIVVDALAAARGQASDADERRQVERLFEAMPSGAHIGMMGVYPARARTMRVHVTPFRKASDLPAFLDRAGLPAIPAATLIEDLEERDAFAYFGLDCNVGPGGVDPAIGVSCYVKDARWVKDSGPWKALLDGLGAHGLAVPEKLTALADSWCGAQTMVGDLGILLVVSGVHHIKVVLEGDRCTQAKAYVFLVYFTPSQIASLFA